jgi:hypothetical protein
MFFISLTYPLAILTLVLGEKHRQASARCYKIVFVLFALNPSGIISFMSIITAALNSKSY